MDGIRQVYAIVLLPCHTWKCVPTAIFDGMDISKVPGCHFPGIDSWIQSWVSWVEPGLPRKPSS